MKFTQLSIGENFEYQDKQYRKVSPLIAACLDTNQQRMIPRSALIRPLSGTARLENSSAQVNPNLDAAIVAAAFEQYHAECLQWLQQEDKNIDDLREMLEQARQQFLVRCGIDKQS